MLGLWRGWFADSWDLVRSETVDPACDVDAVCLRPSAAGRAMACRFVHLRSLRVRSLMRLRSCMMVSALP